MDKLLPLGTVIKIKASVSLVMVIGYYPVNAEKGKVYRYLVANYPFGVQGNNSTAMMDETSIEEILFTGYCDSEAEDYYKRTFDWMETNGFREEFEKQELL